MRDSMRDGAGWVIKRATQVQRGGRSCNPKKRRPAEEITRALIGTTAEIMGPAAKKNAVWEKKAGESPPLSTRPRKHTQMM
jgi:hypothetical protein